MENVAFLILLLLSNFRDCPFFARHFWNISKCYILFPWLWGSFFGCFSQAARGVCSWQRAASAEWWVHCIWFGGQSLAWESWNLGWPLSSATWNGKFTFEKHTWRKKKFFLFKHGNNTYQKIYFPSENSAEMVELGRKYKYKCTYRTRKCC